MSSVYDHKPIGLIYLNDEPPHLIIKKWFAWLIVMVLFILIVLVTMGYFDTYVCSVSAKHLTNGALATRSGVYVKY